MGNTKWWAIVFIFFTKYCYIVIENEVAFGDPENNLSFAYTMNLLTGSMLGDQRALKLVEETYNCLWN